MADAGTLTQEQLEILVARELRKAGLDLRAFRVQRRDALPATEGRFRMTISALLGGPDGDRRVLIECHNRLHAVSLPLVEALAKALAATRDVCGIMVSTSSFERDAIGAARPAGIALLRVADGRAAYESTGWGVRSQPPSWLPELVAQVVGLGPSGEPSYESIAPGNPRAVLDRLVATRSAGS